MLLTLTASSLGTLLGQRRSGRSGLSLLDLPAFTKQTLGLHGLNLTTSMLAGVERAGLETLRERADKAGCACLLLIEPEPQALADSKPGVSERAAERIIKVVKAAHLLGCNAAAVSVAGAEGEAVLTRTAERLRQIMGQAELMELNLLVAPHAGLTATPERVTELLKKVGGFRIGTFPDFQAAAASPDPTAYLRRLTPYASVVSASTVEFVTPGSGTTPEEAEAPVEHKPYDLRPLVAAITSVGYDGTLAVEYRGGGDPTVGVLRSRAALEAAIEQETGAR
jgi:sugar phosphate isomerase/epimerase